MELPDLGKGVFKRFGGAGAGRWVEDFVCSHFVGLMSGGRTGHLLRRTDAGQDGLRFEISRLCHVIESLSIIGTVESFSE